MQRAAAVDGMARWVWECSPVRNRLMSSILTFPATPCARCGGTAKELDWRGTRLVRAARN